MILQDKFREKGLDPALRLIEITGEHPQLLDQLVGKDDVHDFGTESMAALRKFRIGGAAFSKTVYGVVDAGLNTVYSAIYVFKTPKPIAGFADVPGNVGHILNYRAQTQLNGNPSALVFYSITNIRGADGMPLLAGAGTMLISALLNEPSLPPAVKSTLSPLRTLSKSIVLEDGEILSDDDRFALAFAHLMQASNPVQKFHMGNGAEIGDIKLRATMDPRAPDAIQGLKVMVNYDYSIPPEKRAENRERFSAIAKGTASPEELVTLAGDRVRAELSRLNGHLETMRGRLVSRGRSLSA